MRVARMLSVLTATASLGTATVFAAPAYAQTGSLTLVITPLTGGAARSVTLTCEPVGGTHPDAGAACAALTAANGDISRVPREYAYCTFIYRPVIASASGTWNGRPVSYSRQFSNDGCANATTGGHVFHF